MTMHMPAEVSWLFPIVVGQNWPDGDEDALWRLADTWQEAASAVEAMLGSGGAATARVDSQMVGVAGESFEAFWTGFLEESERLTQVCTELAGSCHSMGLEVEYTKYLIIAQLLILAAEIVAMLAAAWFTFGASAAGIPAAQAATRATVQIIFNAMVAKAAEYVAVDALIQSTQILDGRRSAGEWDLGRTRDQAVAGAGAGFGKGFGRSVDATGWEPQTLGEAAMYGFVGNTVGETFGRLADDAAHGRLPDLDDAHAVAVGGATGVVSGGSAHAIDDLLPEAPDLVGGFVSDTVGGAAGSYTEGATAGEYVPGPDDVAAGTSDALGGVGEQGREALTGER